MDLSTVQIILTLFTFVSVLGTCLLIVQYIDLEAKEQLSVRKKHKKVQKPPRRKTARRLFCTGRYCMKKVQVVQ